MTVPHNVDRRPSAPPGLIIPPNNEDRQPGLSVSTNIEDRPRLLTFPTKSDERRPSVPNQLHVPKVEDRRPSCPIPDHDRRISCPQISVNEKHPLE